MPDDDNKERDAQTTTGDEKSSDKQESSSLEERLKRLEADLAEKDKYIKELRDESATRRIALKEEQEKHLAEQGKWKELAEQRAAELEQLSVYKEQAEALSSTIRQSNEARIQKIREDMRPLIPTDYSPERLATWLDANERLLMTPSAPDIDAGAGMGGAGKALKLTPEQKAIAKKLGISEEKYLEQLKKELDKQQ